MICDKFFSFYKKISIPLKILLIGVVLVFAIFWVIGSLAKFDRAIMFFIGVIVGAILVYFYYPYINDFINFILEWLKKLIN